MKTVAWRCMAVAIILQVCLCIGFSPPAPAGSGVIFGTVFSGEAGYSNGLAGFSLFVYSRGNTAYQYVRTGTSGAGGNYTFYNVNFGGNTGAFKIKAAGNPSPSGFCRTAMSNDVTVWSGQSAQLMIGPNFGWGSCGP